MTTFHVFRITPTEICPISFPDVDSLDAITRRLPPGLYTTFRTFDNGQRVLGLRFHLRRLYAPARRQDIRPVVEERRLRQGMAELLSGLPHEARVRLILTFQGDIYLAIEPFSPLPPEVYQKGVGVITVAFHRARPELKATDFIEVSQQARQKVQELGAFEALMVSRGRILEGLTSNFFYVRDGQLGTARRGILAGVTRRTVLRLAREKGIRICYQSLATADLPEISEAFLTSSSRGVVPIVQIDGRGVGEGQVGRLTRCLLEAYKEFVNSYAEPILP